MKIFEKISEAKSSENERFYQMNDSSSPLSVSEESIKIKYEYEPSEGEVKLDGLDELIGSLSNLSLESKCC